MSLGLSPHIARPGPSEVISTFDGASGSEGGSEGEGYVGPITIIELLLS